MRAWLRAHVIAGSPPEQPLRILLHQRLVDACDAGDRRLKEQHGPPGAGRARAENGRKRGLLKLLGIRRSRVSETDDTRRRRHERPEIPHEMTDEIVVEFLALLGPDLGAEGKAILSRVARDAPAWLVSLIDGLLTSIMSLCPCH